MEREMREEKEGNEGEDRARMGAGRRGSDERRCGGRALRLAHADRYPARPPEFCAQSTPDRGAVVTPLRSHGVRFACHCLAWAAADGVGATPGLAAARSRQQAVFGARRPSLRGGRGGLAAVCPQLWRSWPAAGAWRRRGPDVVLVRVYWAGVRCPGAGVREPARSSATSTIMSSCPPTMPRRPTSTRMSRASSPKRSEAASAWRRKLE